MDQLFTIQRVTMVSATSPYVKTFCITEPDTSAQI